MEWPIIAMYFLLCLKPWLVMECFGLPGISSWATKLRGTDRTLRMYSKNSSPDHPGRLDRISLCFMTKAWAGLTSSRRNPACIL